MRAAWGLSLLVLTLLAQPALGSLHQVPAQVGGGAPASGAFEAGADPLVRPQLLFLTADGGIVHEPPAEGTVVAPMALPGAESVSVWAHDAEHAAAFEGDTAVALPMRVHLPAFTASSAALFTVSLLQGGEAVATAEAGPQVLLPGETTVFASLPTAGLAFPAGESLGLSVALRSLSTGPGAAPSVEYLLGPSGANLTFALRFPSLDALGHDHAAGDRHVLRTDVAGPRSGDLGGGVWGLEVQVPAEGAVREVQVPAAATRVRFHLALGPGATQEPLEVTLPGGPAKVYAGEVVVREVAASALPATVACVGCGEGAQQDLVRLSRAAPVLQPNGEPLQPTSVAPRGLGDAYAEAGWLFILFVPAGLMLAGSIGYVLKGGGASPTPRPAARPASRPPASAQARGGNGQRAGQPQALQPRAVARRR